MKSVAIVLAGILAGSGCASVARGTTDQVVIHAEPADATIRTSLGHSCPRSPCTVEAKRKSEFTAYAEKDGYKPGQIHIGTKMSGAGAAGLAGNILIGGIIGVGVDAATGATLDHLPNPAHITLVPVGSPGASTNVQKPTAPKHSKEEVPTS